MTIYQKAYLGSTPLFREKLWYENSSKVITQVGGSVTITANSSAHTKGAWTELIGSSTSNSSLLMLNVTQFFSTTVNTATLLDIAFGASGSEIIIAGNIAVGSTNPQIFEIPLKIPSGTRISARIQSVVSGGKTGVIVPILIDAGNYDISPTTVDVIGGDTASSRGISFSGNSGTWVQAIASTSRAYKAVILVFSAHSNDIASLSNGLYSVGVGSNGNELVFGTSRHSYLNNESSVSVFPFNYLFGYDIPAGSRLAVKHPITSNPERYGFTLICIP